jgi:hypothetical protein
VRADGDGTHSLKPTCCQAQAADSCYNDMDCAMPMHQQHRPTHDQKDHQCPRCQGTLNFDKDHFQSIDLQSAIFAIHWLVINANATASIQYANALKEPFVSDSPRFITNPTLLRLHCALTL